MSTHNKTSPMTLSPFSGSARWKVIAALALLSSGCADEQGDESYSGKKKIAYAPYQSAQITHTSPVKVEAVVAAATERAGVISSELARSVISTDQPSTFTVPKIIESAQGKSAPNPYEQSKIAAGWPGGDKKDGKAPAAKPAQVKAPASRPSSRPVARPTSRPAAQPASKPAGHPAQKPSSPVAAANYVYGEISLDPKLVGSVKAGSVLFVIVRRHVEGGKGMLIAATKQANISKDSFPVQYVVKQQDAMMGAPLVGKVTVSARIDQDGDAISKQPGDLVTEQSAPVMVGENPVKMTLKKAL